MTLKEIRDRIAALKVKENLGEWSRGVNDMATIVLAIIDEALSEPAKSGRDCGSCEFEDFRRACNGCDFSGSMYRKREAGEAVK